MVAEMRRFVVAVGLALVGFAPVEVRAGEARCWTDKGVVVVAAALGDIAGDFILDLSAPHSQLHETTAQAAGLTGPTVSAPLQLAGETAPADFAVTDLDARGWGFPTNIAGVIGQDALGGYEVELRFYPCRLTLRPSRGRPPSKGVPIQRTDGVPTVIATLSDGTRSVRGRFAIDTGTAGVRVSDTIAMLDETPKGVDPNARTDQPARIAGVEFTGRLLSNAPASLETQAPSGLVGSLGDVVWFRYAWLRLSSGRLELGPAVR